MLSNGRCGGSDFSKTEEDEVQHEVGKFLYNLCIFNEDCFILDDDKNRMMKKVTRPHFPLFSQDCLLLYAT